MKKIPASPHTSGSFDFFNFSASFPLTLSFPFDFPESEEAIFVEWSESPFNRRDFEVTDSDWSSSERSCVWVWVTWIVLAGICNFGVLWTTDGHQFTVVMVRKREIFFPLTSTSSPTFAYINLLVNIKIYLRSSTKIPWKYLEIH